MKERLEQFLRLEQVTPAKFADILGIQRSGISHILSGRNKPSLDFIEKISSKYPLLNLEWLITGKGKVYKESLRINSMHENVSQQKKEDLFTNISTEDNRPKSTDRQVLEEIEETKPNIISVKKIKKVILVYSDNTFKELISED